MPSTAPRSRACGASTTCRRRRARPRSRCSRRSPTAQIKALWIACTNPAQSMPDQATVRRALERAEFVVVQEAFATTATCAYADLLLPATTWGEKDGTVTNSERRISRVRAGGRGARRGARRLGDRDRLRAAPRAAPRSRRRARRAVAVRLRRRPSRSGTSTARRRAAATSTSPASTTRSSRWRRRSGRGPRARARAAQRLYDDGVFPTADGRARFVDAPYAPPAEPRDARFPFALNTGRLRDQWHGMSRTGSIGRLFGHVARAGRRDERRGHGAPRPRRRRPGRRRRRAAARSSFRRRRARRRRRRRSSSPCTGARSSSPGAAAAAARTSRRRRASRRRQCADPAGVLRRSRSSPS